MKKILTFIILLSALALLFAGLTAFAQSEYHALQPIPGLSETADLSETLQGLFNIVIAVGVLLAVIMLAVGGLEYMGSDVVTKKETAKERMTSAILGLLILFGSIIFFIVINPSILNTDISFDEEQDPSAINNNTSGPPPCPNAIPNRPSAPCPPSI